MAEFNTEEWRDIPNYEGCYQVSNLGRVKSLQRIVVRNNGTSCTVQEKSLKLYFNKQRYHVVSLFRCGKRVGAKVHRLVAVVFLGFHSDKVVNHKDGNKINNQLSNLEWITQKENVIHARDTGLLKPQKNENNGRAKLKEFQVLDIRKMKSENMKLKDISKKYSIGMSQLARIISGESWGNI
jgi:hypothetical protein